MKTERHAHSLPAGALLGVAGLLEAGGLGSKTDPFALLIGGLLGFGVAWWLTAIWPSRPASARPEWAERRDDERRWLVTELVGIESLLKREIERSTGESSLSRGADPETAPDVIASHVGMDRSDDPAPIRMGRRSGSEEERRAA
jgi:hypothetical protein